MGRTAGYSHQFAHVIGEYWLAVEEAQDGVWTQSIASTFDSDQPQEEYPWLGQTPKLTKWRGERTVQELRNDKITIVNDEYETGIDFPLRDWQRDKTGQIRARVGELADATAELEMELLGALILANGNAYDSVPFFSDSHAVGGVAIDNNMIAADGLAGGSTPTAAQQAVNIQKGLERLLSFRGDKNRPLNRRARKFVIMIPTNMLGATMAALDVEFVSSGATNTLRGIKAFGYSFEVIVNPDLDGAPTVMYMFVGDARIRPFIVQKAEINIDGLDETSEHAKKTKRVWFFVDAIVGCGYGRFELAVKMTLA